MGERRRRGDRYMKSHAVAIDGYGGLGAKPGGVGAVRRLRKQYSKYAFLILLLVPGLVSLIIFNYIPIYGLVIAFKDFKFSDGIWGSAWVGLQHFADIFRYPNVWRAVKNSLVIGSLSIGIGFVATLAFSLLMNELRNAAFKRVTQTISYLPYFLSWLIVAGIFINILAPNRGLLNNIIASFGGQRINFLMIAGYFRPIIIISGLWRGIGWGSIIYLAAIAGANPELYDAANIDGVNRFQKMRHITLPAMYPVITVMLILSLSGVLGGDFEQIFNLVTSQTMATGEVLSLYIYRQGLGNYQYSFATAVGLLNTLVSLALILSANAIAKRFSDYAIL
jgi:putative aldouronate transport system permease protein